MATSRDIAAGAARFTELPDQFFPDEGVHDGHVLRARCLAGADRPDRLIGHHAGKAFRQAARQLPADHFRLLSALALGFGLADTDDRVQPRRDGRDRLLAHQFVGFPMVLAPFGMAKITQLAPESASIGAEISPVWAPLGSW